MKVFPRVLELSKGERRCEFCIENSSTVNDTLLFKIRRTEPKVVDFQPKNGVIPAGASMTINITMTDLKAYSGRVIVKFVAIKSRKLCPDFNDSWDIGLSRGMAKKIVEVRNLDLFNPPLETHPQRRLEDFTPSSPPKNACFEALAKIAPWSSKPDAPSLPTMENNRNVSPQQRQEESVDNLRTGAVEALDRAQELYNTVKAMNTGLKMEIARKKNSTPRAIDRKLASESDSISKGLVDDLASVDTMPLSPHIRYCGKETRAITPTSSDRTTLPGQARGLPASPVRMCYNDQEPYQPEAAAEFPPTPSEGRKPPSHPRSVLSEDGWRPVSAPSEPSLAHSPLGDMRLHRRHSPVKKGSISPGIGEPINGSDLTHAVSASRSAGIDISIPSSTDGYSDNDSDIFESVPDMNSNNGREDDLLYSRSNLNDHAILVEPKMDFSKRVHIRSDNIDTTTPRREESHQNLHHESNNSRNIDDEKDEIENKRHEMNKYMKLEQTALNCSEWREVVIDPIKSAEFEEILKDISNPLLTLGSRKFDSQKIAAIIERLSAAHLPLSELPIEDTVADGEANTILEVEVFGEDVTDEVARMALRLRTAEIFYAGDMVTSIKIDNAQQFTSLWALDELFDDNNTSGRSGDVIWSRSRLKKHALSKATDYQKGKYGENTNGPSQPAGMGSAFEDMLLTGVMKLAITNCRSFHSLPSTLLSSLSSLIHLNLSHNKIREIKGDLGIILPYLKRINLSHNLLKSLDKLQGLPSLIALDASHNYIQTLHHGPHMLLPLADHLISLNLLDNPICSLPSYAGETVSLLPNLICFDMRYTKLFVASKRSVEAKAVPLLPAETERGRVVSVPKLDHHGSAQGNNYVVIEKTGLSSTPGYRSKHSPSKRSKKVASPTTRVKDHVKNHATIPQLIPFYPHYGQFRASPGVLVQTTSKGFGQPHQKGRRDDDSVENSINSIDSADDADMQARRATRAFKAQQHKTDKGSKYENSQKTNKMQTRTVWVDTATRQLHARRASSHDSTHKAAPSSSTQTLLSNLDKQGKPKSQPQMAHDDSDNSVDTELRQSFNASSNDIEDDDSAVPSQSDSIVSDLSGHWNGKENYVENNKGRRVDPAAAESGGVYAPPPMRFIPDRKGTSEHSVGGTFHSVSDLSSIRRFPDDQPQRDITQNHNALHPTLNDRQNRERVRQTRTKDQNEEVRNNDVSSYARGRQLNRSTYGTPQRGKRGNSAPRPASIRKQDLKKVIEEHHRHFIQTPATQGRGSPLLGSEAWSKWQRGVEKAAIEGHRKIARDISGTTFGPHRSSKPPYGRCITPSRARSVDRSASSIRPQRSNSFSEFGDIRGTSGLNDLTLSSSYRNYTVDDSHIRASVDNSMLYHHDTNARQRISARATVRQNISLEDLAKGLVLGSEWEERNVRAQSGFSTQLQNELYPLEPSIPIHYSDIERYAYTPRERIEFHRGAGNKISRTDRIVELRASKQKAMGQPSLATEDPKPIKHVLFNQTEGINIDAHVEVPPLHMGNPVVLPSVATKGQENPENTNFMELSRGNAQPIVEPDMPQIFDVAFELNDLDRYSEDNLSRPGILNEYVHEEAHNPVDSQNKGVETEEYLKWLEQQVEGALEQAALFDESVNALDAEQIAEGQQHFEEIETKAVGDHSQEDDNERNDAILSAGYQYEDGYGDRYEEVDKNLGPIDDVGDFDQSQSTPVSGSPNSKSAHSLDSKGVYPPTPSPMPMYKHPRHMAMKPQQHTPNVEWDPLTRILRPEDPAEDLYPRYHA